MAHVVVFNALAFQRVKLDNAGNPTIEPDGEEDIVAKGGRVPSYVQMGTLSALESAGMIVAVGDDTKPVVEEVGPIAPIPTAPIFPPTGPMPVMVTPEGETPVEESGDFGPAAPVAPKASDNRGVWEGYAVASGKMTRDEAASYENKGALIEALQK
jgi:hypothetical protein